MSYLVNVDLTKPVIQLVGQVGGGPFLSAPISNLFGKGCVLTSVITAFGTSVTWEIRGFDPNSGTDYPLPITAGAVSAALAANATTPLIVYPGITAFTAAAAGAAYNMALPRQFKVKCTIVGTVSASAYVTVLV